jgi:hypothetical protein
MADGIEKTYSYIGQRYVQGGSSLQLVSFCASANDIKQWAGVPAKTTTFHGGFQRALSDRYKAIIRFFDAGEASPTSIVVAFRENALAVSPLAYPESWVDTAKLSQKPEFVHVNFKVGSVGSADSSTEALRCAVAALLKERLDATGEKGSNDGGSSDSDEAAAAESAESESVEEIDDDADDEIEAPESAGELDDEDDVVAQELDVGHSKLRSFYAFISDKARVDAWLAEENDKVTAVQAKPKLKKRDKEFISTTPEERLRHLLVSLLRPAMIVDGQHRVWGAYSSDKAPIVFSVCAIKDADWVEQVFQFVVLNRLAKPISPSFLTSILNTSLTNQEVERIEKRLEKIEVRKTDRVIMKYLNHDDRSPFFGLIGEPGELLGVDNKGKLSDKGMIRLAKRWMNLKNNKKELEMFLPALGAKKLTKGRDQWASHEVWSGYFFAFWSAVKSKYEEHGLWVKQDGFHLLYIVTMHAMQDMFIEAKSKADGKFLSIDDFNSQVKSYFKDVSPTFFRSWEATGLQSGDGPKFIREALEELRGGKQLKTVMGDSPLFIKPKVS